MTNSPKCLTCKFFEQQTPEQGACRRFPPVPFPVAQNQTVTIPVTVRVSEWCGEHVLGLITATSMPVGGTNAN